MAGQDFIRKRMKETNEIDELFKKRSFGQNFENNDIDQSNDKEKDVIKRVQEKINSIFKERILTDSKREEFKMLLRNTIMELLDKEPDFSLDIVTKRTLAQRILDNILGYGPIQDLLENDDYTEIMVSRWDKIYVEKNGKLILMPDYKFDNDEHLKSVIEKIVQPIGRRIDESEPLVDARLPDGSRVNATIKPISPDGATLTIRKFPKKRMQDRDYLEKGSLTEEMIYFLKEAVAAKCNIIVSGGTGTGKTTLLNVLSNYIPQHESIVTVEDSCELTLNQDNVRRLESRPANMEGTGEIPIRRLVKNSLRMRPDRIVVGEIRDGVIVDLFRAFSSGHDGSLTTIHANSPKDLVESTLPILFGMSDMELTESAQRNLVSSSVDLIVQIERFKDGSRKISAITHVVGLGKDGASKLKIDQVDPHKIYLQDIFRFKKEGLDNEGKVMGKFYATGYVPKSIINKIETIGHSIPPEIFNKQ